MPTYEYKCASCSTRLEVVQRITAEPLTTCEACGGRLRRVLFPVGVVYKGTGFYTTDYARKNGRSDETEKSSEAKSEPTSSGESAKSEPGKETAGSAAEKKTAS